VANLGPLTTSSAPPTGPPSSAFCLPRLGANKVGGRVTENLANGRLIGLGWRWPLCSVQVASNCGPQALPVASWAPLGWAATRAPNSHTTRTLLAPNSPCNQYEPLIVSPSSLSATRAALCGPARIWPTRSDALGAQTSSSCLPCLVAGSARSVANYRPPSSLAGRLARLPSGQLT